MRTFLLLNVALLGACGGAELVSIDNSTDEGQTLNAAAVAYLQDAAPRLGMGRGDSVRQRLHFRDDRAQEHTRFDRFYQGLPVRGADLIVHRGDLLEEDITTPMQIPIDVSTRPTLTLEEATQLGQASLIGERSEGSASRKPTLVIYAYDGPEQLALAYEVVTEGTQADGTPSILHTFVDAHSGQILRSYDEIETAAGVGKGYYNGTVTLEVTKNGTKHELRDGLRGGHRTTDAASVILTSTSTTFGNGTDADRLTAAADAHYGAAMTWDYFKTTHNRNGIANDGKAALSRVHYGNKYNNAFWSDSCFCMTYGDGDGKVLKPLVAIDVAGHEMSHGVTSRTAKLVYSGESGGLNEATSDIFGTAVEFFAKNTVDTGDYLIGEKIAGPSLGKPFLRSMSSPKDDGRSIDHYSLYKAGIDVHFSSGIANNFFYLLSEGGTNKTSGKRASGIGRAKAEKIWYRALTTYFTSGTTFKQAREGTLKAARDLYGAGKGEETAVTQAWTAVGVN